MIEKTVLDYLIQNHITAYMERPVKPPTEYVIIEKTGSSEMDHVYTSTFAFISYSDTLYNAATLNGTVKNLISALDTIPEVSSAALESDYNYTSATEKQYRYQAVFNITHKGD